MNNIIRYFIAAIIMMSVSFLPSKAVVVFDADADDINGKNSITKDGITISTINGEIWKYNGFIGDLTISSEDKDIVMVGLTFNELYEVASNSFEYDTDESQTITPFKSKNAKEQVQNSNSRDFLCYDNSWFYCIWRGSAKQINTPTKFPESIDKIYVYYEGDELPQKTPFALYEWQKNDETNIEVRIMTLYYGYTDFLPEYGMEYENWTLNIEPFSVDGSEQTWSQKFTNNPLNNIQFDASFSEYNTPAFSDQCISQTK